MKVQVRDLGWPLMIILIQCINDTCFIRFQVIFDEIWTQISNIQFLFPPWNSEKPLENLLTWNFKGLTAELYKLTECFLLKFVKTKLERQNFGFFTKDVILNKFKIPLKMVLMVRFTIFDIWFSKCDKIFVKSEDYHLTEFINCYKNWDIHTNNYYHEGKHNYCKIILPSTLHL